MPKYDREERGLQVRAVILLDTCRLTGPVLQSYDVQEV